MAPRKPTKPTPERLYTLEVAVSREATGAARMAPLVTRTLQLRGGQTLEELHRAIAAAFGRPEDVSYEFQFDAGALHPEGRRYVVPAEYALSVETGMPAAGPVNDTTLDALALQAG